MSSRKIAKASPPAAPAPVRVERFSMRVETEGGGRATVEAFGLEVKGSADDVAAVLAALFGKGG